MRTQFATAELVGLPGMPTTVQGVLAMADRQHWPREKRAGRGGGFVFPLSALPSETQAALMLAQRGAMQRANDIAPVRACVDHDRFDRLPQNLKDEAQRRMRALDTIAHLTAQAMPKMQAVAIVAENCGESARTVRRWQAMVAGHDRTDWLPALAPRYTGRLARAECPVEAWEIFKADYLRGSAPAASACYERLQRVASERAWQLPSLDTFRRRLDREISPAAQTLARAGREAAARMYPAQERDHSVFRALEAVNADGHKFDVFVKWPNGSVGRPMMLAWQCIYSGKILAWRIGETECVELVRLAFGDLVERWGIPKHTWLDNGRGFAAKWLTGRMKHRYRFKIRDDEPAGIFTQLGLHVHWTTPYHGQAKPIERAFRDLCEYIAKHPRCEGAYTGNRPDNKPENYGARAVPIAEFEQLVAEEITRHNARQGRESAVCAGRSFDQVFDASYAMAPITRATEAQRRLLLLAAEGVSADRESGVIRLFDNRYWSEALGAVAGRKLVVRFDPQRLEQPVHVYGLDGRFIATAPCIARTGFADVDQARKHARARNDYLRAQRQQLDAERRMDASDVANLLPSAPPTGAPSPAITRPLFNAPVSALKPQPTDTVSQRDFEAGVSASISSLLEKKRAG